MSSPEQQRMDALTEANVRLLRRLDDLETRVRRLEGDRAPATDQEARAEAPEPPPLAAPEPDEPVAPPAETIEPAAAPLPPRPREAPQIETQLGLTWVNRIGVVTLILGAAFFFKYAIDNEWIGETGRVVLGVIAALAALASGDRLWNRGQTIFAQGLTGLGIALLYLSFYATFGFYRLLPQSAAFALMLLTTVAAGVFALRYNAIAIAILGMAGGYATPVLLSTGQDRPWILFSYVCLLNLGALAVARRQNWRPVEGVALAATAVLYIGWFDTWFKTEKQTVAAFWAAVFYATFASGPWTAGVWTAQVLSSFAMAAIFGHSAKLYFGSALAIAAAGLGVVEWRRWPRGLPVVFAAFWLSYAAWQADGADAGKRGAIFAGLTIAFALFLAWVLRRAREARVPEMAVLGVNGAVYYGAAYAQLHTQYKDWMGLFAVAVAAAYLLVARTLWHAQPEEQRDPKPALLAAGIAIGFLTLAAPIQFAGWRITLAWAIEAAALTWLGSRTGEWRMKAAGLAIYALVLIRLFTIDAWVRSPDLVINARFLTFLVAAVSAWLGASWLRTERSAGALYIGGHFVMLWNLGTEVLRWAQRGAAAENLRSVEMTSLSILMASYALLLVTLGVITRTPVNRLLGLGLLALVVLKLYLVDVWELRRLYRMIAFLALGALLLATSYLYSRFKKVIDEWWRNAREPAS